MGLCPETPIKDLVTQTLTDRQVHDMWYDWFCKETSLVGKGRRLLQKLRVITPSPRFNAAKTYVFFKNNCPLNGRLYDDFRICDIKTGDVLYCVTPSEGYDDTRGQACVWGNAVDTGKFEEVVRGTWHDVKLFFSTNRNDVLKQMVDNCRMDELRRQAAWDNKVFDREAREKQYLAEEQNDAYVDQLEYLINR